MLKVTRLRLVASFVGGLGLAALAVPASGQAETITVAGTVIDLYCYTQRKEHTGMHHGDARECALACVKYTSMPVGILTSDGRTYEIRGGLVANNNAKIAPYVTQRVRITGPVSLRDGMPTITADDLTAVK